MASDKKFSLLRSVLRALGLSQEACDEVVNWIVDLLTGESKPDAATADPFPYRLQEHFLTPAELRFFQVLRAATGDHAVLCAKVGLADLFRVHSDDQSRYRIYSNKIDRKHVDFVLCDPATMRPLVTIELDDKSHRRADRRARDAFVDGVFQAAGLPLLHVPVKASYAVTDLAAQVAPYLSAMPQPAAVTEAPASDAAPCCPQCGSVMVLRTARKGANTGQRFWGCSAYPTCRSMLPYTGMGTDSLRPARETR